MKKLALILAMLSLSVFAADRVYTDVNGDTATLLDKPCEQLNVDMKDHPDAKAAMLVLEGKLVKACYKESEAFVVILTEFDDLIGPIPKELFQ